MSLVQSPLSLLLLSLLVLVSRPASCSTIALVEEGVYSRVTVRISEEVPRQFCSQIVQKVKDLMTSTSERLFEATDGSARFEDVWLTLPESCAAAAAKNASRGGSATTTTTLVNGADFEVTAPHPLFGARRPHASQFAQCGATSSLRRSSSAAATVKMPYTMMVATGGATLRQDEEESNRQLKLAGLRVFQEFVRSRFGVFLEQGLRGDQRFPEFYEDDQGQWRRNRGCNFTDLVGVCAASDGYNTDAPTKQNLLCDGRSAVDVIRQSPDLRRKKRRKFGVNLAAKDHKKDSAPWVPNFRVLAQNRAKMRVVLALDTSQRVGAGWLGARDAIFRLLEHMQDSIEFGVVTFDASGARVAAPPTGVRRDNRAGLLGRVPHRLSADRAGCAACAMEKALGMAQSDGGVVIMVSGSPMEDKRLRALIRNVRETATPVFHVAFNADSAAPAGIVRYGRQFLIPAAGETSSVLRKLSKIFLNILGLVGGPDIWQSHRSAMIWKGREIRGTFRVEESLRANLWIVLTSEFKEDVESFEITSPSGIRRTFPKYEHGIVYFALSGLSESGIWSYVATLHHSVHNGAPVTVEVFGEPNEAASEPVDLRTWTNVPLNGTASTSVIIYASVVKGKSIPVLNANVVATITKPGSIKPVEIHLKDNGSGYPDVTTGDGIYSAYLTHYSSEPGFYGLSVRASDGEGRAHHASKPFGTNTDDDSICCGSQLPQPFTIPTQPFNRYVVGEDFYVAKGVQYFIRDGGEPRMRDVFPPSRVTDLHVGNYINGSLYATLVWTAPGGDLDAGAADRYELRCYTKRSGPTELTFSSNGIPVHESLLPRPGRYGQRQEATVSLPWANEMFFYAIVAVDATGNRGRVSNLASAFVIEVTTTTQMEMTFQVVNNSSLSSEELLSSSLDRETMLYLVAAGIVAFILVLSLLFFAAVCRAKKRQEAFEDAAPNANNNRASSSSTTTSELSEKPIDVWKTGTDDFGLFVSSGHASWPYATSAAYGQPISLTTPSLGGPTSLLTIQQMTTTAALPPPPPPPSTSQPGGLADPPRPIMGLSAAEPHSSSVVGVPDPAHFASSSSNSSNSPVHQESQSWLHQTRAPKKNAAAFTDCSDSDHEDKNVYNVPSSRVTRRDDKFSSCREAKFPSRRASSSASSKRVSNASDFCGLSAAERKRRQESLV